MFDTFVFSFRLTRGHRWAVLIAGLLASSFVVATAGAQMDAQDIFVGKIIAREGGVLEPSPYEFEGCIEHSGIDSGTLTVPTTPTTEMSLVAFGPDELCVEAAFDTSIELDAAFPNGTYIFAFTDGVNDDSISVVLNDSPPAAFLDMTSPVDGETGVSLSGGLNLQWDIVEEPNGSGCAATTSCGDSIVVDLVRIVDDSEVFFTTTGPGATSVLIPDTTPGLDALTEYESEAAILFGTLEDPRTTDSQGDAVLVSHAYGDVNVIHFTTGAVPMDITEIGVFKLIDRVDGTPIANPYGFEACVAGTGITSATVTPAGAAAIPLVLDEDDEYCFEQSFADSAALELDFPNGLYAFDIDGVSGTDSKTLDLQATEPGAYLDIINPLDGATVPADQDLNYTWELVEKANGAGCIVGMNCADEIFVEIDEIVGMNFVPIVDERLPITDTGVLIPASDLNDGNFYEAEIETFSGFVNFSGMTDMGDSTITVAIYEDINQADFMAVPEPGAGLLGIAALLTLAVVRRRRV